MSTGDKAAQFLGDLADKRRLRTLDMPVAVVVAHPDDEVAGLGAQLPRFANLWLIHVTDGAPRNPDYARAAGFSSREAYARARRAELTDALAVAGITPRTEVIGVADQDASHRLAEITEQLAELLRIAAPAAVITHPYEGGHPDHDATAFAVHAACRLLAVTQAKTPAVVEMTSYHNRDGRIEVYEFLPGNRDGDAGEDVTTIVLREDERALKRRMFDCFPSQQAPLDWFPIGIERFRAAPAYDFTAPPHEGQLFYEMFDWGITGPRWREMARNALAALPAQGCC
jgi:LmbE family N-acetylglucosaminyl deacetylase